MPSRLALRVLLFSGAAWMAALCGVALAGCRGGASSPKNQGATPLARYLDLPRATAPSLSPDGRRLAFLSDLPGHPQPFSLELPGPDEPPAAPRSFVRMATMEHRVQLVHWLGEGTGALLGYDRGGSENTQLSVVDLASGGLRPLTDQPTIRHLFGAIDAQGKRLAYSSNERNGRDFDLMVRDLSGGAPRRIHESKGHLEPRDFAANGLLLVVEKRSSSDEGLHLMGVPDGAEAGPLVSLTPADPPARYQDACLLGPLVLTLTDRGRDHLALVAFQPVLPAAPMPAGSLAATRLNAHQSPMIPLLAEPRDLDALACSPSGDRFAVALNVDGRHEVRVFKVARSAGEQAPGAVLLPGFTLPPGFVVPPGFVLPPGFPPLSTLVPGFVGLPPEQALLAAHGRSALIAAPHKLPPGVVRAMHFSKDGSTLAVQLGQATEPDQLWTIQVNDGATAQRTSSGDLLAGLPPRVEPELVTVRSFDGLKVPMFLFRPPGLGAGRKAPAVVWVHGGPESQFQPSFSPLIQALVARGIAVAAPNVRGSTGYGKEFSHLDDGELRENSVADLAEVNRWLRARGDIDGAHIGVLGGSYGGYMVLAALTRDPDLWAAGVDVVGIANFRTFLEKTAPYRRAQREAEYGSLERDGDLLDRISPIHKVDRIRAPLFVIHGANDPRVPVAEAEQIVDALQRRKQPVVYLRFDDEGHGLSRRPNQLLAYTKVLEFLEQALKPLPTR
jgi:dipeptidyl aminopeptidase/acylaminoacyl peptidase